MLTNILTILRNSAKTDVMKNAKETFRKIQLNLQITLGQCGAISSLYH